MTAGELAEHFDLTKPTLSRHFGVLKEADLIQGERQGTSIIYRLNLSVLEDAMTRLLEAFRIGDSGAATQEPHQAEGEQQRHPAEPAASQEDTK